MADCLAGFCPNPAWRTFPIITSSTSSPFTEVFLTTSLITVEPSSIASNVAREPLNLPMAVLTPPTIYASIFTPP
jgi:hypothetical protein